MKFIVRTIRRIRLMIIAFRIALIARRAGRLAKLSARMGTRMTVLISRFNDIKAKVDA
jgi:hypothetical protein